MKDIYTYPFPNGNRPSEYYNTKEYRDMRIRQRAIFRYIREHVPSEKQVISGNETIGIDDACDWGDRAGVSPSERWSRSERGDWSGYDFTKYETMWRDAYLRRDFYTMYLVFRALEGCNYHLENEKLCNWLYDCVKEA